MKKGWLTPCEVDKGTSSDPKDQGFVLLVVMASVSSPVLVRSRTNCWMSE